LIDKVTKHLDIFFSFFTFYVRPCQFYHMNFSKFHLIFHLFRYAITEKYSSLSLSIGNCIKFIAQISLFSGFIPLTTLHMTRSSRQLTVNDFALWTTTGIYFIHATMCLVPFTSSEWNWMNKSWKCVWERKWKNR
jgi:hypothetical protein